MYTLREFEGGKGRRKGEKREIGSEGGRGKERVREKTYTQSECEGGKEVGEEGGIAIVPPVSWGPLVPLLGAPPVH